MNVSAGVQALYPFGMLAFSRQPTYKLSCMPEARLQQAADATVSEAELLARLQSGDHAAVAIAYGRYRGLVNQMIWRLLGADPDHSDLVNEVFIKAFQGAKNVKDPAKFKSWLLSIAGNLTRDELRRRAVRRRFARAQPKDEMQAGALGCSPELSHQLSHAFSALGKLPVDLRMAFMLRHIEGYELTETAEICGCSLATTKRRLKKAEDRFVELVEQDPPLSVLLEGSRWRRS